MTRASSRLQGDELRACVEKCRDTFDEYAQHEKANRNREMADMCRAALEAIYGAPQQEQE